MKKFKLFKRNKNVLIQLVVFIPIVIITGVDLLYPTVLILSVLVFKGIISLYKNDPYFKYNADKQNSINPKPHKTTQYIHRKRLIDTTGQYLGYGSHESRRRALGF